MTYDEYIAQQQQAMDEEQQEDSCFLEYQPEGQFVRRKIFIFLQNYLHISIKSSTFAAKFVPKM